MLRFIFTTFAFLGYSFYVISGGADYQPREGSRQAVALEQRAAAMTSEARPARIETVSLPPAQPPAMIHLASATPGLDIVSRSATDLSALGQTLVGLDKTLDNSDQPQPAVDKRIESLSLAQPAAFAQAAGYATASTAPVVQDLRDLRRITGTSVNMRAGPGTKFGILQRVGRDTQVEVLETMENGWIRLRLVDSKRVGWVSAKLVSAAPS
jgi:hypothetical protein